jgi:tripartite ATP-independent transporter DctM subunit
MDSMILVMLTIGLMLLLMAIGVPIYASLGVSGLVGMVGLEGFGFCLAQLKTYPYMQAADYMMMVVPMFILMGYLSFAAGLSKEAYTVANKWMSRMPAGLAMATVMASALFGACCGSSVAVAATMGKVAIPEMKEQGYDPSISAGTVAAGGLLGIMIPPSVILVFYGALTEVSIGKMLIAGILPGILTAIIYCAGLVFLAKMNPTLCPSPKSVNWLERLKSLRLVWGVGVLFIIVIGGIYGGVVTATEAAAVGAVASFVMYIVKCPKEERNKILSNLKSALTETTSTCGMIFIILLCSGLFSFFMTLAGVPAAVNEWASGLTIPHIWIVILFLLILLPMGMFLDPFSILVISLPITFPVVVGTFGYNPLWYGILMTLMIQIGLISPPVGLNAFIMKGACPELSLEDIFKGCAWFIAFTLIVVVLVLLFPWLATGLASYMQ